MPATQRGGVAATFVTTTLQDLVRINSVNPSLAPGGCGEGEIASYIARSLRSIGLEVAVYDAAPSRPSVVGILRGSGGGRSLMLNAHVDTVGVEGMPDAFSGDVRGRRLYGRGAYDMKGSVAACIGAAKAVVESGRKLTGDLMVALVADEEHASLGTASVISRHKPTAAIVTEPSALQICLAHKGFVWFEIETEGRAYHGSQFRDGVDANMRMGWFLSELDKLERDLRTRTPHQYVGPPSLHAATLAGGTGLSTYAARSTLQIERRTVPGEAVSDVIAEIESIADRLTAADPSFKATVKTLLVREAFEVSRDASIVQSLAFSAEKVMGRPVAFRGENPWMDSALLAAAGVETVVFGPDGSGAHSSEEWVDLDSVEQLTQILASVAVQYCSELVGPLTPTAATAYV